MTRAGIVTRGKTKRGKPSIYFALWLYSRYPVDAMRSDREAMLETRDILDLLSGRRRGWRAALLRAGLAALTPAYRLVVAMRNAAYDRGWGIRRVSVPVISVGNLTTGGTGKTPFIGWLASQWMAEGRHLVVLSRGYGSGGAGPNDEALELAERLPGLQHIQNPDRVQAARQAVESGKVDCLLLDDGFQHRRLARDFDLVLIDATQPFGFEALLPRGLLREPLRSLRRADAVVVTRCEQVSSGSLTEIEERIRAVAPELPTWRARTVPHQWIGPSGERPLDHLAGCSVMAFCGIGNPDGFLGGLSGLGVRVVAEHVFPDHHPYTSADWSALEKKAKAAGAEALVCTGKDLVKCATPLSLPLWGLQIALSVDHAPTLLRQLDAAIDRSC